MDEHSEKRVICFVTEEPSGANMKSETATKQQNLQEQNRLDNTEEQMSKLKNRAAGITELNRKK